ncbi:type IV secretion system protein [Actinomyces graevenitzii]|uniref:type IV secretion system protein n=1 Tax=Actinomyces graevenitzii TaxID=55565 RepID=UPI0015E0D173|nr:type IV secretion system protein [Actinomyces graevenitzii]
MLKALVSLDTRNINGLSDSLKGHNPAIYKIVTDLHSTAVLPISAVVISIILVLELARNATHMEGDHQMGVKIIAATMFKSALLVVAAQNSMMFLDAINEVSTKIIAGITKTNINNPPGVLPARVNKLIDDAGTVDQAGLVMMLLLPFVITIAAQVVIQVMVILRFAELYVMTAFASLPIAFLGHPDTKSMGISYLQKYAAVSLQAATLMIAVAMYTKFIDFSGKFASIGAKQSLNDWMFTNYAQFVICPVLLMILILSSGKFAKAIVGQ